MATILLVDDDPDVRRALRRLLARAGHDSLEAGSADAALEMILSGTEFGVVICDVLMPGRNGLTFYASVVERAPRLRNRIIFLSGAASERRVHEGVEELGAPLLSKLDDLQLVVDAVRIALMGDG